MDWLKELLEKQFPGEENSEKVQAIMEAAKATFPKHAVPKEQYNKKSEQARELEAELTEAQEGYKKASEQITELQEKAGDNEELKKQFGEIQSEYESYKQGEEARLKKIRVAAEVEKSLLKERADKNAVDYLAKEFDYEKLNITDEGKLDGFEDQLKAVKEKRPTLFAEEQRQDPNGEPPAGDSENSQNTKDKYWFLPKGLKE